MTEYEIEDLIQRRKNKDIGFARDLEGLLEQGLLEVAAKLIQQVVGVVVNLSEKFWNWLKSLFETEEVF